MTEIAIPASEPVARRTFYSPLDKVEWRAHANGTDYTLEGHAAVFNSWSETLSTWEGEFKEKIAPGAFTRVLRSKPDVRLLINHDENFPLARTRSGSMKLTQDDSGLAVWAKVAPTSYANDLRMSMQRGDIDQMSFAFTVDKDTWSEDAETKQIERTIERVGDLYDVSVVTFPAYPDTDAALRELRHAREIGQVGGKVVIPMGSRRRSVPDMQSVATLVEMHRRGQEFIEGDPEGPNALAMGEILGQIESLAGVDSPQRLDAGDPAEEKREIATPDAEPVDEDRDPDATPDEDPVDDEDSSEGTSDGDPADEEADVLAEVKSAARAAATDERAKYLRLLGEMTR